MGSVLIELEADKHYPAVAELDAGKSLERQLLIDSRQFAQERRAASWWHFATTFAVLLLCVCVAGLAELTWVRLLGSLVTGLILVRIFILYHDYQHQSYLKGSNFAGMVLGLYGYLMLTPPSVWKRSHDHHHRNNSKLFGASIGSFPIMTTTSYQAATPLERAGYRMARSPLVIIFGYVVVFLIGMCVRPLILNGLRHWDAPVSIFAHFGIIFSLSWFFSWQTALVLFVLPTWIATSAGSYLFYVQHNFPGAKLRHSAQWTYTSAALQSSSYLEMGRLMQWLTGNIGYHHVHHTNSKIPFYRLPEAMDGLVPLQSPMKTSLRIRDIIGCLRLKLWDTAQGRLVSFADARLNVQVESGRSACTG